MQNRLVKLNFFNSKLHNRFFSCTSNLWSSNKIFSGSNDAYNGVTIDTRKIDLRTDIFSKMLVDSLHHWGAEGKKCIWFKVHIDDSICVPLLAKKGFNFHHARDEFVMMYKWLPVDNAPNLPPPCHTNLGVGAMVLNKNNQLLAVSEKSLDYPHWKLPGGYVERGEDIKDAAVREVREETGVDSEFVSLITFRHTHNMMYGNSDIYVLILMNSLSDTITKSQREISNCKWMDIEEYTSHPHVHELNKTVLKWALDYKKRNLRWDLQKMTVKYAVTREINLLTLTGYDR